MATRRLNPLFRKYRNQRRLLIVIVSFLFIIVITLFILAYTRPSSQGLQTIVFLLLIGLMLVLFIFRQIMFSLNMHYHYFRMIQEEQPPFSVNIPPMSKAFLSNIITNGFQKGVERPTHDIYYQIYTQLPYVKRTGPTVVWIIILKDSMISPYGEDIERDFQQIKLSFPKNTNILNELTIVAKHIEVWNQQQREKLDQIVNFSLNNRAMITIQFGQLPTKKVYALRPKLQYPNKYYYSTMQIMFKLMEASQVQ
jgi:hypothetical protein